MATRKIGVYIVTSFWFHLLLVFAVISVHTIAFSGEEITQTSTVIMVSAEHGYDSTGCLVGSMPCKSLEYVSKRINNTEIVFSVGVHLISSQTGSAVTFDNTFNVTLIGSGDPWSLEPANTTVLKCYSYNGSSQHNNLKFINPHNVTIKNVIFEDCGTISSQGLFARNAKLFHINNCIFRNNNGPAIKFENTANISIINTLIFNNSGQIYDDTPITEEYGFNLSQSNGGIGIVYTKTMRPILTIRNCTFDSNHALMSPQNSNDTRPSDYQPFGTGGGLFIHFANASYGQLEIKDCKFIKNTALVRGGALYLAFWGHSEGNHINIQNSSFSENYCADSGGAVSLNSFSSSHENLITITDSNFTENKAEDSCGAMVYRFSNELISVETAGRSYSNKIILKGCIFRENHAASVSALGLFMFGRVGGGTLPVLIEDTIFESNVATYINCNTNTRNILRLVKRNITSAVFGEMSIELKGNTSFLNNIGGGITIVERRIDIHDNVKFVNNCSPYDGGGLSLEDDSFIQLFSASHVVFKNNSAETGGAISVFTPIIYKDINLPFYFNTLCFIQYQILISDRLAPEKWELNMTFEDNKAFAGGGALYVNDISPCGYTSTEQNQTDTDAAPSFNHSVLALPQFTYRENTVVESPNTMKSPTFSSIASDLNITVDLPSGGAAPCEIFVCSVQGFDQSGNVQTTVFQINAGDQSCSINNDRIFVKNMGMALVTVFGEDLTGYCDGFSSNRPTTIKYKLTYNILDQFTGDLFPENHLEVNITCCHTGYIFDKKEKKCVFDGSRTIFIAPNHNNRYVYIKTGYFAQHIPENNQFISGIIPPSYHKCNIQSETTTIQGCLFKFDNPYEQCSDDRTGFMCGKCPPSKGLTLNLNGCRHCQASDVILFILFCIFVIVASILIMTFDIGLSNSLRGFLFFAQVVNIVYQRDSGEGTTLDYSLARLFGRSLYFQICLSSTMDALSVVLLGLIVPLMMLLMVLLFIFLARHIRYLSQHQSVNGIWLIIFLLYVYTARTSFDLLRCVPTYDIDDNYMGQRYYYDGSIECYRGKHLYYALVSFLLLCTIIIPGPFIVVLISYRHFKRTVPFKDVATKGIKQQYYWWSAYDLLRRLAFMLIILFDGLFTEYQQFLLTIVSIVCLIITARLHPYQNYWDNLIETLILADLMLITAYYLPDSSRSVVAVDTFGIIFLFLPFVYCIFFISISVTKKLWLKFNRRVQGSNEDTKTTTFTKSLYKSDEKSFNRADDNAYYHEFRDELLVIDSIIQ